jgi:hypothetical protein
MKNEFENVDKLITEALSQEEAQYFKELEEQTIDKQVFGIYKGKMGLFNLMMTIITFPIFGFTVYAGYKFFTIEESLLVVRWGGVFFMGMMMVSILKLFSWNQMDKNAIIREMKRLEYQIALLSKK